LTKLRIFVAAGCFFWLTVAVCAYSFAALSTLSGEEMGWGILVAPLEFPDAVTLSATPALLAGLSVLSRSAALSASLILAALVFQIATWPIPVDCGPMVDNCEDAYATYRIVVIGGWMLLGAGLAALAKKSVDEDPYLEGLRKRNERRRGKGVDD
jgi:hypothetical protein